MDFSVQYFIVFDGLTWVRVPLYESFVASGRAYSRNSFVALVSQFRRLPHALRYFKRHNLFLVGYKHFCIAAKAVLKHSRIHYFIIERLLLASRYLVGGQLMF